MELVDRVSVFRNSHSFSDIIAERTKRESEKKQANENARKK